MSNTSVLFSSQTARAPKTSEAGLILPILNSLVCNSGFGLGVKCRYVQRAGSTRQWYVRFYPATAGRGQYKPADERILHMRRRDCVLMAELRRRLHLTSIPVQPARKDTARRPGGELIRASFCLHRLARCENELEAN